MMSSWVVIDFPLSLMIWSRSIVGICSGGDVFSVDESGLRLATWVSKLCCFDTRNLQLLLSSVFMGLKAMMILSLCAMR